MRNIYIYIYIILYFYYSTVMLMWSRKAVGKSSHNIRELSGVRPANENSSLKTPTQSTWLHFFTYTTIAFHWPWSTPMQRLFSIGHGLHSRIACFLVLFTARCICQLHPPGSSQVKAIVCFFNQT